MTRNDIIPGDILTFTNNHQYRVISISRNLYLIGLDCYYTDCRLDSMCLNNLKPLLGMPTIQTIQRCNEIIWTQPIEMTVAEIEKALKLTPGSLRIKD